MRYSRIMVSLRPGGTFLGGRRSAHRWPPRLTSKISLDAPPEMNRTDNGSPAPGRPRSFIQSPKRSESTSPAVRSASESDPPARPADEPSGSRLVGLVTAAESTRRGRPPSSLAPAGRQV